ncbi:rhodanese-like domain-containing protein [Chloroflexota bacterium]
MKAKLDAGANIIIIDSRSKENYDQSHIAGAISLPLNEMNSPYDNFKGYDEIITYCT